MATEEALAAYSKGSAAVCLPPDTAQQKEPEAVDRFEEAVDCSRRGIDGIGIFNLRIDSLNLAQALRAISIRIAERRPGFIVTPNVDHVCRVQRDPEFCLAYNDAFLSLPDGMPIMWAGRMLGTPFRAKLSGSDMINHLCRFAADNGHSVFFFGASEGVGEEAAAKLRIRHPNLDIAGVYSPPYRFEADKSANAEAVAQLRNAAPDICFIALSSPRQELWMWRHYRKSGIPVMIGVGAGLDFAAGSAVRAPRMFQRVGLEWFWRLCMEPRRLWRRYLVYDMLFFALVWRALAQRWKTAAAHIITGA
jgi:N-acetylglucosaminyldiphosphoundecaprenol N-acetyl-beta-D-mannosaminyltransferase